MHLGTTGDGCVEASHSKQDGAFASPLGDDMRPALRAEVPLLSRRGFKTFEQGFTPGPAKALSGNVGYRREGGAVRLAARGAMAVNDWTRLGAHLVGYASAHAAAREHRALLWNRKAGLRSEANNFLCWRKIGLGEPAPQIR